MISLLFGVLILCLICWVIFKFLPDPFRTVAAVVICIVALLWVWQNLGSFDLGHFAR